MALFVLIVVGLVVSQTWLDWRDSTRGWVIPDWAKGVALGGLLAVCLAATASFASVWLQDAATQWTGGAISWRFWIECGVLLVILRAIVLAARRKGARMLLLMACVVAAAFYLGMLL